MQLKFLLQLRNNMSNEVIIKLKLEELNLLIEALHAHIAELQWGEGYASNEDYRNGIETARKLKSIITNSLHNFINENTNS